MCERGCVSGAGCSGRLARPGLLPGCGQLLPGLGPNAHSAEGRCVVLGDARRLLRGFPGVIGGLTAPCMPTWSLFRFSASHGSCEKTGARSAGVPVCLSVYPQLKCQHLHQSLAHRKCPTVPGGKSAHLSCMPQKIITEMLKFTGVSTIPGSL